MLKALLQNATDNTQKSHISTNLQASLIFEASLGIHGPFEAFDFSKALSCKPNCQRFPKTALYTKSSTN